MPRTDGEYPAGHPKGKFWQLWSRIAKNQLRNIQHPILLILSICLQYFIQRFRSKHIFISNSAQSPLDFTFLQVFSKTHSLLKLIFRVTELQQRRKFCSFQKAIFCSLASSNNLVLKGRSNRSRVYICSTGSNFYVTTLSTNALQQ